MKKLISVTLLLFFVVSGNAQEKNKQPLSELNKDQLNLALAKSKKTIKEGKILTFGGLAISSVGIIMLMAEAVKVPTGDANGETAEAGAFVALFGGIAIWTGIPVWIVGGSKKHKIELELTKFNQPGSASINGIGLEIRF
jgi:hypothetical protein